MRLSFMKIPDNNTRQLSIFSAETAILAALMNVSIDNCSRDDLAEHLWTKDTLSHASRNCTRRFWSDQISLF